ncbi:hypothetical protein [Maridesulfovibrio sp.]|uniref:hypothetical protein n=1 Tax=Maridesulfovibrio sp. TaxID=2795000 RepID=UPI002A18BE20|nr:hypothetical protein [Maridesulfovibrio sp.]
MRKVFMIAALFSLLLMAGSAFAGNAILDSLEAQGAQTVAMADQELDQVRGTAAMPMTLNGVREHHVTYKGWGSYGDYRSYNYMGSSFTPGSKVFKGKKVVGDYWQANDSCSPNSWQSYRSYTKEYLYRVVTASGGITSTGFHSSSWNRPASVYMW